MWKDGMKFQIEEQRILEIKQEVLDTFEHYVQRKISSKESGGLLIGRIIESNSDVVIDFSSKPARVDTRKRFLFFRKREPAQDIVNKKWKGSDGTQIYLGEWHTHPEPFPNPSKQDIKNWLEIYKSAHYEQDFLLFIIVGIESIGCWSVSNGKHRKLDLI